MMSSLTNAIQFRFLSMQLTLKERHSFLQNICSQQPDLLIDALFAYFCKASDCKASSDAIKSIADIIEAREDDKAKQLAEDTDSPLPKNIIGSIASFLDQNSYAQLSQCNRAVYLSTQSPNLLQKICCHEEFQPSHFGLVKTAVVCKSSVASMFPSDGRLAMKQLKRLEIHHWNRKEDCDEEFPKFDKGFLADTNIASTSLTHLIGDELGLSELLALLPKFPNLQFLALSDRMHCDDEIDSFVDSFLNVRPSLRGLSLSDGFDAALDLLSAL